MFSLRVAKRNNKYLRPYWLGSWEKMLATGTNNDAEGHPLMAGIIFICLVNKQGH